MDPQELLTKARLKVAEARAQKFSDEDIDAYLKSEIGIGLKEVESPGAMDYLRSALQGLTSGFSDEIAGAGAALVPGGKGYTEARDDVRANLEGARAIAKKRMLAAEIGGGAVGALAGGAALRAAGALPKAIGVGSKILNAGKVGGAAGAVAGAGYSEADNPVGVAQDAAMGGALGAGLGVGTSALGGLLGRAGSVLKERLAPGAVVRREAATALPADAAKILARQERLAPGTAIPADLTKRTLALAKTTGLDDATSLQAEQMARARIPEIQRAMEAVGARYNPFMSTKLPVTAEVQKVLMKNGVLPDATGQVEFSVAQRLRTAIRERLKEAKRAGVKQDLKSDKKTLDRWLQSHIGELEQIDSDFGFLSSRLEAAKALAKTVEGAGASQGGARAAGAAATPGAPASRLGVISEMFQPNPADRAKLVQQVMMQPGGGDIMKLLKMRQSMLTGPGRIQQSLMDAGLPFVGAGAGSYGQDTIFGQ